MQVINVCMCVCGWVVEEEYMTRYKILMNFHVVFNFFGWLPIYSLWEEFKAFRNAKTTI